MTLTRALVVSVALGFASGAFAADQVVCKDGTTSVGGGGACSGHGGIDKKAATKAKSEAKRAKSEASNAEKKAKAKKDENKAEYQRKAPATPREASRSTRAQGRAPSAPRPSGQAASSSNPQNTDPTGATARCKDGSYSHAKNHSGACSRHGGVAEWMDGSK